MRPSIDEWAMNLAKVVATRSTCCRRHVGCVLLDLDSHIIATGYNGVAAGLPHCNDQTGFNFLYENGVDESKPLTGQNTGTEPVFGHACKGVNLPSGQGLDLCEAIHAEQNALLQCSDVRKIHTCYSTTEPCVTCTKLLLNTGCQRVVFAEKYVQPDAMNLWLKANRGEWVHFDQ